jgi:hypothetical protein
MAHCTDRETKKRLAAIRYAQGSIAHLAPDRNLADELIADRRAEEVHEQGVDSLERNDGLPDPPLS